MFVKSGHGEMRKMLDILSKNNLEKNYISRININLQMKFWKLKVRIIFQEKNPQMKLEIKNKNNFRRKEKG